jgi:hypothetical protein
MGGDGFDGLCDLCQGEYFGLLVVDQWGEDDVNVVGHHDYGMKIEPDFVVMSA